MTIIADRNTYNNMNLSHVCLQQFIKVRDGKAKGAHVFYACEVIIINIKLWNSLII